VKEIKHPGQIVEGDLPVKFENQELLKTGTPTFGSRIYSREEVERVFGSEKFMKRLRAGALHGETLISQDDKMAGTESNFQRAIGAIDESRVSHRINDITIDADGVVRGTVTAVGPYKGILELAKTEGHTPVFGLRASCNFKKVDGVDVIQPGSLDIVTFDLISFKEEKPAFWPDNPLEG